MLTPSFANCTLEIPIASDAFAVSVIVPETLAPVAGEVIETFGGVKSKKPVLLLPEISEISVALTVDELSGQYATRPTLSASPVAGTSWLWPSV